MNCFITHKYYVTKTFNSKTPSFYNKSIFYSYLYISLLVIPYINSIIPAIIDIPTTIRPTTIK